MVYKCITRKIALGCVRNYPPSSFGNVAPSLKARTDGEEGGGGIDWKNPVTTDRKGEALRCSYVHVPALGFNLRWGSAESP